jgi:SAM-dependent methyltransferase
MNVSLFQDSARRLYARRSDLQIAFPDPESLEYWVWCNSHGVIEDPELARFAPPLPPEDLRALIGAGSNAGDFLTSGASIFLSLSAIAKLNESKFFLDFGCGCGRLLRFLSRYTGLVDLVGVDVEPRHLQWNSCNLTFASFALTDKLPPLPFPAGRFDTVVCLSVFSHLREATHRAWTEEFARVIAPGGRIIVTTLGTTAIESSLADQSCFGILQISPEDFARARSEFSEKGFSFVLQSEHSLAEYGIALASEKWIQECWGPYFEVLNHVPGCFGGWQDGYVLRRRSGP